MTKTLGWKYLTAMAAVAVAVSGCKSTPPAASSDSVSAPVATASPTTNPASDEIIATANGTVVTRQMLDRPLIEAYGLTMLLNVVQLELAKQQLHRAAQHIDPEYVQTERAATLAHMFTDADKSDYDTLLDQFLQQQHLSRIEFEMVIETNTCLRKLAEPKLAAELTEDRLHSAFSQIYGENRVVRDIQLANVLEAGEAKRRLAAGKPFEEVAREMSLDRRTGALGGELPPFSAQSSNVPQAIKDAAFLSLKLNEVSDPLSVQDTTHLIKLVNIIPPKIVKYEDVKDSVRQQVSDQLLQYVIKQYRSQLAQEALQTMKIEDPILNAQWKDRLEQQTSKIKDRDSAMAELNRTRRQAAATQTTAPTSQSTGVLRPPATMPGAIPPGTTTRP